MKNTYALLALIAATATTQCAEIHLSKINNKTLHQIQWEKLPLPGMLGKMRPQTISRFGSETPKILLVPPVRFSFKNPNKPSQAIMIDMKLSRAHLKRRLMRGEDPRILDVITLFITLKNAQGAVLRTWTQRINPFKVYELIVDLKGLDLSKTEIITMSHEIPEIQTVQTLSRRFNIEPVEALVK